MRVALNLFLIAITMTACAPGMRSFELPYNVAISPQDTKVDPGLGKLSGAWSGTWFTPGWGLGYNGLLVVERIERQEATVLYAWSNSAIWDEGWYRQKAQVSPGLGLEWTRDGWKFAFQLDKDGNILSGTAEQVDRNDKAFITMKRTPFKAPLENRPPAAASLPRLPAAAAIRVPPGFAPDHARFLGIWEGAWDSGIASRLVIQGIAKGKASIVYEWSDDPKGTKVSGFRQVADVSEQDRTITWGEAPKLTFHLSADGQTLRGEWEQQGTVSLATLKKVTPR